MDHVARWITIIYLVIIILTTAMVLIWYPKTVYFWSLLFASFIWAATGALAVWYSYINGVPALTVFFFVVFIGLYWTVIYETLEKNPIVIINADALEKADRFNYNR